MRLHRLRVRAFGPFPDEVDLDLDALSESGIFLVHGPTGSGKTSLLDAVCFALFGRLPGDRPDGTALLSHHAAPGAVPEVVLELTVSGRRLRITRSPEHVRPSRRGTGTTVGKARVLVEEHHGGDLGGRWTVGATGAQECGQVIGAAVGMRLAQFAKVVLLPQGDFAAFLRADAESRREVLERLFDVSRYADVEAELAARRRESAARAASFEQAFAALLARAADVLVKLPDRAESPGGQPCGSDPAGGEPGRGAVTGGAAPGAAMAREAAPGPGGGLASTEPGVLADELEQAAAAGSDEAITALAARDRAARAADVAAAALVAGSALARERGRGEQARAELAELDREAASRAADAERLERAARASGVAGDLRALRSRERAAATALEALSGALAPLDEVAIRPDLVASVSSTADPVELTATLERLRIALRGHEVELHEAERLTGRRAAAATARAAARRRADELDEAATAAHDVQTRRQARHAAGAAEIVLLTATAADADAAAAEVRALTESARLRAELDQARAEVTRLTGLAQEATERAQTARAVLLDLRQRRLEGMAAELAAGLGDGDPCPVCGSAEHPSPAVAADPVRAEAVEEAHAAWERLDGQAAGHRERLAGAARLVAARTDDLAAEPRSADELLTAVSTATARAETAARAAQALAPARAAQERLTAEIAAAAEQLTRLATDRAGVLGELDTLTAADAADAAALEQLLARHTAECGCAGDAGHHARVTALVEAACGAARSAADAQALAAAQLADTTAVCRAAGFADPPAAQAAALALEVTQQLRARLTSDQARAEAAGRVLADTAVVAALQQPAADIEALTQAAQQARTAAALAERMHAITEDAARDLSAIAAEVAQVAAQLTAARAQATSIARLAETVAGTGPDNALRMRLSAFVLAGRLERVVQLANERLDALGSGRYRLAHDDSRDGARRSGLGLLVEDLWTGRSRDPASLSGGESFMASLALALGLADAVREESGGAHLHTLFVDEGFGTLDEDSLEQVLGVLDQLRDGGRAVGVVSHVADLRSRIPAQLRVVKGPAGSSVQVVTGVA